MDPEKEIVDRIHRIWTASHNDGQDAWRELVCEVARERLRDQWPALAEALDGLADVRFVQGRSIPDQKVNLLYRATHPSLWRRLAPRRAKAARSKGA